MNVSRTFTEKHDTLSPIKNTGVQASFQLNKQKSLAMICISNMLISSPFQVFSSRLRPCLKNPHHHAHDFEHVSYGASVYAFGNHIPEHPLRHLMAEPDQIATRTWKQKHLLVTVRGFGIGGAIPDNIQVIDYANDDDDVVQNQDKPKISTA